MVPWCNIYPYAVDQDSFNIIIDKNSLWDGLNIQKGELCVKGISAQ
jgi:hypothetical protein